MKKRLMTLLLAICMVLSLAQTAFAASPEDGVIYTEDELVAALADGGDVVLGGDIIVTNGLTIPAGVTVTLDLNGNTISGVHGSEFSLMHVENTGDLTVKDSGTGGKITYAAGGNNQGAALWVEGKLTLESGIIEITDEWVIGFAVDVRPNAWGTVYTEPASFTMNGGKLEASDSAVRVASNSSDSHPELGVTFTMNNGVIDSAYDGIFVQYLYQSDLKIDVKNGAVTSANSHAVRIYGNSEGKANVDMTISGGEFTGNMTNLSESGNGEVAISGGTFSEDVSDYLAEGKKLDENGTVVVDAVASVNGVEFASLQAAIDEAGEGDTVTILKDIALTAPLTIAKEDKITLDLNGKEVSYESTVPGEDMITNKGDLTITDKTEDKTGKITYNNTDTTASNVTISTISCEPGSVLMVEAGTIENTSPNGGASGRYAYAIDLLTNGNLGDVSADIKGGTVISKNYMGIRQFVNGTTCKNSLTISDGTVIGASRAVNVQVASNALTDVNDMAELTITGGEMKATNEDGYSVCVYGMSNNISVEDGNFIGWYWDYGTYYDKTEGAISGGTFDREISEDDCAEGYVPQTFADDSGNTVYGVVKKVTLTFNAGAGEGSMDAVELSKNSEYQLPACGFTAPANHHFKAWEIDGEEYAVGDKVAIAEDTTVIALYTLDTYTVTYKNGDTVVGTVTVEHGADAAAPEVPAKEGYTGAWDHNGKNITADTTINTVYTIKKYTVTYMADNQVVATVEVEHGKDATAPAIPEKEGYTKTAPVWDKDGKYITADTTINAVYTINEYTITFMDGNRVYKTLTVKHGEAVEMPAAPKLDGYTVTWDKTVTVATSDMTINAVYTKDSTIDPGDSDDNDPDPDDSKDDKNPQTGDNSNLWMWITLLVVSAGGALSLIFYTIKRKSCSGKYMR